MRIILVRHGETLSNRERLALGRADPPLSDLGLRQAGALAAALVREVPGPPEAVYSSPLLRARQTAEAITGALGLTPASVVEALTEMDVGETDGLDPRQLRERFPDFLRRWVDDLSGDLKMPGGESLGDVQDRAWQAIESLRDSHAAEATVVAVSHNFVLHTIVCRVLSLPLAQFRSFQQDLASITAIEFRGRRALITRLNETCHLAGVELDPGRGEPWW